MESLFLIVVTFCVSVLGTIVGVGGGFLLVPVLMYAYPAKSPSEITFISLVAVLCNAVSGAHRYSRMKRIDVQTGLAFGAATAIPAVLGVFVVARMETREFAPIFGGLLVVVAVLLLRRRWAARSLAVPAPVETHEGWTRREFTDADGIAHRYAFPMRLGVALSSVVGFVSSFFGIGGGIIHVPIMTQVLRFPVHVATATSVFVLAISAGVGVATHLVRGGQGISLPMALAVGVGAVAGGQVGARLSRRVKGDTILLILAGALVLAGLRLIARAFG